MSQKNSQLGSSRRGGYRENAGRKPIWVHQETCTIRVPKIFASKVLEIAHVLDISEKIDNVTLSIFSPLDLVKESIEPDKFCSPNTPNPQDTITIFDYDTQSKINNLLEEQVVSLDLQNSPELETSIADKVTKSKIIQTNLSLTEALIQAKQVLKSKKSARYSIARLLAKLYSTHVSCEDLK